MSGIQHLYKFVLSLLSFYLFTINKLSAMENHFVKMDICRIWAFNQALKLISVLKGEFITRSLL